jgi:hypothetical protein
MSPWSMPRAKKGMRMTGINNSQQNKIVRARAACRHGRCMKITGTNIAKPRKADIVFGLHVGMVDGQGEDRQKTNLK